MKYFRGSLGYVKSEGGILSEGWWRDPESNWGHADFQSALNCIVS